MTIMLYKGQLLNELKLVEYKGTVSGSKDSVRGPCFWILSYQGTMTYCEAGL